MAVQVVKAVVGCELANQRSRKVHPTRSQVSLNFKGGKDTRWRRREIHQVKEQEPSWIEIAKYFSG